MRNKYPGPCFRCSETVAAGAGHFQRLNGRWLVQHADCAIKYRGTDFGISQKDIDTRELKRKNKLIVRAAGTGKSATKVKKILREQYNHTF